jgi:DNA-binding Xre family transcriptional regulator
VTTTIRMTKLKARLLSTVDPETGERMSQTKVAVLAGLHPAMLSDYANGKKPFTQKNLIKLCRFFQCEPNDLAGDYEITFPE